MACGEPGSVRSADGTRIAWFRSGDGPPLVLVHGTTADHSRWSPVLEQLAASYTVYAIDRRGRGSSGDAPGYAGEREFEDVAAVVDAIGRPVFLLGHSFGGLCALEGATRTANVARLVLYEPVLGDVGEPAVRDSMARIDTMIGSGDREGALTTFMTEIVGLAPETVEQLRSLPVWQARLGAAHTITREDRVETTYHFDPARFEQLTIPTLLLIGSESPPLLTNSSQMLAAVLPDVRVEVLEGQHHAAMDTGPDVFLRAVVPFLDDISG